MLRIFQISSFLNNFAVMNTYYYTWHYMVMLIKFINNDYTLQHSFCYTLNLLWTWQDAESDALYSLFTFILTHYLRSFKLNFTLPTLCTEETEAQRDYTACSQTWSWQSTFIWYESPCLLPLCFSIFLLDQKESYF